MFSYMSVRQSVSLSMGGSYVTITHNAMDLAVHAPLTLPPGHQTWNPLTPMDIRQGTP